MSDNGIIYTIGLKSENPKYRNNFIASTLHCLINIEILTDYINKLDNKLEGNPLFVKYKELLKNLQDLKKKNNKGPYDIKDFEKILFNKEEFQNIDRYNPKYLLNYLITEFNLFLSSETKNTFISDAFFTIIETINKCPVCDEYLERKKKEVQYLNYDLYQYKFKKNKDEKKEEKEKEEEKEEEEENNIYDCLKSYVNIEEKEREIYCEHCKKTVKSKDTVLFQKLPKHLIIYVDYGDDINFKLDDIITFNKELYFSKIKKVEKDFQDWEYYLSSLISVKEIMKQNEYFYTFCKEIDQKEKYICYNADIVQEVLSIDNKTDNKKIEFNNKKERFPFILIYTSLNKKENKNKNKNK